MLQERIVEAEVSAIKMMVLMAVSGLALLAVLLFVIGFILNRRRRANH